MAITKPTRPVIELDFDQIKSDIISFIKADESFSDYNFEGSALNTIADMLAYNTFNNAYYANMLHAEGFLDSAQKRASVVSRAKELGYTPISATCSTAFVSVDVSTATPIFPPFSLVRGDTFYSSNDSGTYTFSVADTSIATIDGLTHSFRGVKLVNGVRATNTFAVDTQKNLRSIFTIPNKDVDISTLKVYVRDSIGSVERTEYAKVVDVYSLTSTSTVYFVQESYEGFYQIYFGGDVLGYQPTNGKIIEIDYFVGSNKSTPDGCVTFTYNGSHSGSTGTITTTEQMSFGGSAKENIESIKFNAVRANSSKNRIITRNDYALEIATQFPFVKSTSVWGGEDNVPPIYGKVFISLQPVSGYIISSDVKKSVIVPALRKKSMMTILPELVDPYYTNIEFETKIKFNPNKSRSSRQEMESVVSYTVSTYMSDISKFDTDYLEPELISRIMNSDPGIISVDIVKRFGFDIAPTSGVSTKFYQNINNPIVAGSVLSSKFEYIFGTNTGIGYIADAPSNIHPIKRLCVYDSVGAFVSDIGYVDIYTGIFDFTVNVNNYLYDAQKLQIRMTPKNDDISVLRNQILTLDNSNSINNKVVTEIYVK